MNASGRQRWLRPVILVAVLYLVAGITFGVLAAWAQSHQMRLTWRLAAWLTSAVAFLAHIGYEHFRMGNSPRTVALHASLAVAVGAFALAVAANVHELWGGLSYRGLLAIALVVWPALAAGPAFVVALAVAAGLARTRPSS
jgi:hypothetical protein